MICEVEDLGLHFIRPSAKVHATWVSFALAASLLFLGASLTWVDRIARATGALRTSTNISVIAAPVAGKVSSMNVRDGEAVRAGDLLFVMQPDEGDAALAMAERRAERAEINFNLLTVPSWNWLEEAHSRETAELISKKNLAEQDALEAKIQTAQQDLEDARAALRIESAAQAHLLAVSPLIAQRLRMAEALVDSGFQSTSSLLSIKQEKIESDQQLLIIAARIARAKTEIERRRSSLDSTTKEVIRLSSTKIEEARDELIKSKIELERAKNSHEIQYVRAPISGIIDQISEAPQGNRLLAGTRLMSIIPSEGGIEIELNVRNSDFPYVRVGQDVKIKFDAFQFTIYGAKNGKIKELSASPTLGDNNSTYKATVEISFDDFSVNGERWPLRPGMTVVGDIRIGRQHPIDIWLDPFLRLGSDAFTGRR